MFDSAAKLKQELVVAIQDVANKSDNLANWTSPSGLANASRNTEEVIHGIVAKVLNDLAAELMTS